MKKTIKTPFQIVNRKRVINFSIEMKTKNKIWKRLSDDY